MVLMSVGQKDTANAILVFLQIGNIGNDQINARHILVGKSHTAVDHDNILIALDRRYVFTDLTQAAKRNDADLGVGYCGLFIVVSRTCRLATAVFVGCGTRIVLVGVGLIGLCALGCTSLLTSGAHLALTRVFLLFGCSRRSARSAVRARSVFLCGRPGGCGIVFILSFLCHKWLSLLWLYSRRACAANDVLLFKSDRLQSKSAYAKTAPLPKPLLCDGHRADKSIGNSFLLASGNREVATHWRQTITTREGN